jgi:uncharacterized protein
LSAALLDVNVLVTLLWHPHAFHQAAMKWFSNNGKHGWATCSLTQAGFVRVVSNPAIDAAAPMPAKALGLLKASTQSNPYHEFWADTVPLTSIGDDLRNRIHGHNQITDAYLLAMAIHRNATLVTFDSRMQALAPKGSAEHHALVILRP